MNRHSLLRVLSLSLLAATLTANAETVNVSTPHTTLLVEATEGQPLKFLYYGDALQPGADITSSVAPLDAYPVYGLTSLRETAMSVTHPDGNMTLDLAVKGVTTATEPSGAAVTTVAMSDRHYPFDVNINYRTYPGSDVIETWAEAVNRGKKPVQMREFASAYLPVRYGDVWLTSLYGSWANEGRVEEAPLKHGMTVIKNKDGARNSHTAHAEVMLSLDGTPRENEGRVIGAALCYGGNYRLRIDTRRQQLPPPLCRHQRGQLGLHPRSGRALRHPAAGTHLLRRGQERSEPQLPPLGPRTPHRPRRPPAQDTAQQLGRGIF